jgi:phage gpG-like protein
MKFVWRVKSDKVQRALEKTRERVPVEALLRVAAGVMRSSVNKTFDEQGSPANSWKPLSPSTIKGRRNKNKSSIKLLQDTGRMKRSVNFEISENTLRIGPGKDVPYGMAHQRGFSGRVSISSYNRKIVIKRKKGVKFSGSQLISGKGTGFVKAHTRKMNIPARPYCVLRPEDPQRMKQAIEIFIQQQLKKEGL